MKRTTFADWPCSVARTVDLIGDWWTPLVLREAFWGVRRFDDFQRSLGIGRNILTQRLGRLVDEGMLERRPYQEHPPRHEYVLTEKGRDFFPVIAALMRWGDRWLAGDDGPARRAAPHRLRPRHRGRGGVLALPRAADRPRGQRAMGAGRAGPPPRLSRPTSTCTRAPRRDPHRHRGDVAGAGVQVDDAPARGIGADVDGGGVRSGHTLEARDASLTRH